MQISEQIWCLRQNFEGQGAQCNHFEIDNICLWHDDTQINMQIRAAITTKSSCHENWTYIANIKSNTVYANILRVEDHNEAILVNLSHWMVMIQYNPWCRIISLIPNIFS